MGSEAPSDKNKASWSNRGDPRMNFAVKAKLACSSLSSFEALLLGGYEFDSDDNPWSLDSDNVSLRQRKNQLCRRLRLAKRESETGSPPPAGMQSAIAIAAETQKQRNEAIAAAASLPRVSVISNVPFKEDMDRSRRSSTDSASTASKPDETTCADAAEDSGKSAASKERGDPRMNRAVKAKLANPSLSPFEALLRGGYQYASDRQPWATDEDSVTLRQRKNQLCRRVRLATSKSKHHLASRQVAEQKTKKPNKKPLEEAMKAKQAKPNSPTISSPSHTRRVPETSFDQADWVRRPLAAATPAVLQDTNRDRSVLGLAGGPDPASQTLDQLLASSNQNQLAAALLLRGRQMNAGCNPWPADANLLGQARAGAGSVGGDAPVGRLGTDPIGRLSSQASTNVADWLRDQLTREPTETQQTESARRQPSERELQAMLGDLGSTSGASPSNRGISSVDALLLARLAEARPVTLGPDAVSIERYKSQLLSHLYQVENNARDTRLRAALGQDQLLRSPAVVQELLRRSLGATPSLYRELAPVGDGANAGAGTSVANEEATRSGISPAFIRSSGGNTDE